MKTDQEIKESVKEKYGQIAVINQEDGGNCGCGCGSAKNSKLAGYTIMQEEYNNQKGYVPDADLKLGCGMPTEYAGIKDGDTVVDLGSGAGNDVFVSRALVGETGKAIGIDFTPEMIAKAEKNKAKLGFTNVEFYLGEIEAIPLSNNVADVVVSNCVLNLVPDKVKAFNEMFRIIKSGGHFCVSDIVIKGNLPAELQESATMYAGCVAGAVQLDEYIRLIKVAGFTDVEIKKTKTIGLPDEVLSKYLSPGKIQEFRNSNIGIFSITVVGYKK
jgi:ubiquinone/menaquinone biosynthesis C-methylase UbiE